MSGESREPDGKMILEIEDKEIELDIYVDQNFKGLRYDLTSSEEIEPMDAAICLLQLVKTMCDQNGVSFSSLVNSYESAEEGMH